MGLKNYLVTSLAAVASGCATLPTDTSGENDINNEELLVSCEPGDRKILHLGQRHRSHEDGELLSEPRITASQKKIYNYLIDLQQKLGITIKVVDEGLTKDQTTYDPLDSYRYGSVSLPVKKIWGKAVDDSTKEIEHKRIWLEELLDFKALVEGCAENGMPYDTCLQQMNTERAALFEGFFPNSDVWNLHKNDLKILENFLKEQGGLAKQTIERTRANLEIIIDKEVEKYPYWAGGASKCAAEGKCDLIASEFPDWTENHKIIDNTLRENNVIHMLHEAWDSLPPEQKFMPLVFGEAHDFTRSVQFFNDQNPEGAQYCLSVISTAGLRAERKAFKERIRATVKVLESWE